MQLSAEQAQYLSKHKFRQLTNCGNPQWELYQTHRGAYTIADVMNLDAVDKALRKLNMNTYFGPIQRYFPVVSMELESRNERLIDEAGCGMFGD